MLSPSQESAIENGIAYLCHTCNSVKLSDDGDPIGAECPSCAAQCTECPALHVSTFYLGSRTCLDCIADIAWADDGVRG